jgi:hypothetical protein
VLTRKVREGPDILGAVTAGLIIILLAIIIILTPTLLAQIIAFVTDFVWQQVAPGFWWWVPANPSAHVGIYTAMYQFFLGLLIVNIIVLILRVLFRDSYRRQIESIGGIVFAAGVTWATWILLYPPYDWVVWSGYLIVFGGVSIIFSSIGYWVLHTRETKA